MKYDSFIGKVENGSFVTLALDGSKVNAYYDMETACEDLCELVGQKKRILLTKAPDPESLTARKMGEALNEFNSSLEKMFGPGSFAPCNIPKEDYELKGDVYVPFNDNQLLDLQMGFILRIKIKNFVDPFSYQPYVPN